MDMDYPDLSYILQKNVFRPNLVPSIPDPNTGAMLSYDSNNNPLLVQPQLTPQIQARNSNNNNNDGVGGGAGSKMSPFLEPPGPRSRLNSVQPDVSSIQWANPNGFLPSSHQFNNNNARTKEATFRVTPLSEKPN